METALYSTDMQSVDRFFHRHGYANVQSFSTTLRQRKASFTDNLFVRMSPMPVYPPLSSITSNATIRGNGTVFENQGGCPLGPTTHMSWWCAPFLLWEPPSKWADVRRRRTSMVWEGAVGGV